MSGGAPLPGCRGRSGTPRGWGWSVPAAGGSHLAAPCTWIQGRRSRRSLQEAVPVFRSGAGRGLGYRGAPLTEETRQLARSHSLSPTSCPPTGRGLNEATATCNQ